VVNSSRGGGSKDTWVLAAAVGARPSDPAMRRTVTRQDASPVSGLPPEPGPVERQLAQQQQDGPPC
jgi:hypothetical protein